MEGFLCDRFGGLILGGAYTWRGLFSEFYSTDSNMVSSSICEMTGCEIQTRDQCNPLKWPHWRYNIKKKQVIYCKLFIDNNSNL